MREKGEYLEVKNEIANIRGYCEERSCYGGRVGDGQWMKRCGGRGRDGAPLSSQH